MLVVCAVVSTMFLNQAMHHFEANKAKGRFKMPHSIYVPLAARLSKSGALSAASLPRLEEAPRAVKCCLHAPVVFRDAMRRRCRQRHCCMTALVSLHPGPPGLSWVRYRVPPVTAQVVPVYFCYFTLGSIGSGGIVMHEFGGLLRAPWKIPLFVCGAALLLAGVWVVTRGGSGGAYLPTRLAERMEADASDYQQEKSSMTPGGAARRRPRPGRRPPCSRALLS
jgi:hypothetical protein